MADAVVVTRTKVNGKVQSRSTKLKTTISRVLPSQKTLPMAEVPVSGGSEVSVRKRNEGTPMIAEPVESDNSPRAPSGRETEPSKQAWHN